MLGGGSLVGRGEELGFIVAALRGDRTRGVVLAGESGVGKTRLAREAAAAVEGAHAVEWFAATPPFAHIPFAPLAHLLEDAAIRGADDRLRIVRRIISTLQARAAGRPLVVVVDDAQWLDPGAGALVHQLVVSGQAQVLLTLRTEEPAPDPIVALWKDGWTERLEVQPLGRLDVEELVPAIVGGAVDRLTLNRFWSLSKGNPLFLHELVRNAIESGSFVASDGVWSSSAPVEASSRLTQLLESRLVRVTAEGRNLLETLAVGEPLPVVVVTRLHGADALGEVERLSLVVVDEQESGQVRLHHPFYGEATRVAMGTVGRQRIMARLADAMPEPPEASLADRLRLVVWRLESGSAVSHELLAEGAEIANAIYDHALAERLSRVALAAGGGFHPSLVLGDALNRQGRYTEALTVLDPLAAAAQTDDDRVGVATARYFALTSQRGFRSEFASVLLTVEEQVRDPHLLASLRATRASLLCSAGQFDEGVELARRTVEEHPDEVTELRAVSPLVTTWLSSGMVDAACAMTTRMLEPAMRNRNPLPQGPARVISLHLPALVVAGRLDDADAAIAAVESMLSASAGTAEAAAFIALARGMSSLQRGQVLSARAQLQESVALLRPLARWRLPLALVLLVEAAALAGDAAGAAAASEEADELVAHHAIFGGVARRARGWAALARGARSDALGRFFDAAEWAGAHGQHTAELFALHDAVRLGGARDAVDRLHDVATRSEGRWAPLFAAHARAAVDDDPEGLVGVATSFEGVGALLLAAESYAQAAFVFGARCLRSRAERAAACAVRLASACEEARSPVLEELEHPLPLTRREREVASLAAEGLSARAVATQLYLSVRTVEGHLHNAYGKLGVNDREALATRLARIRSG